MLCRTCNLPLTRYAITYTGEGTTRFLWRHPSPEDAQRCLWLVSQRRGLEAGAGLEEKKSLDTPTPTK